MGTHPIFESDFDCLTECNVVFNAKKPSTNHAPVLPEKEFFGKTRIYLYRTNRTNIKFITNQRYDEASASEQLKMAKLSADS